jgi:hypothetical protein
MTTTPFNVMVPFSDEKLPEFASAPVATLDPGELLQSLSSCARADFGHVDTAFVINADAVRCFEHTTLIAGKSTNPFTFWCPDTDPSTSTLLDYVNHVIIRDPDIPRRNHVCPRFYMLSIRVEDLDTVVLPVTDEDAPIFITTDVMHYGKLTRTGAWLAPRQ